MARNKARDVAHDRVRDAATGGRRRALARLASQYGMLGVLLLLAVFFSLVTLREQQPTGEPAARALAERLARETAGAAGAAGAARPEGGLAAGSGAGAAAAAPVLVVAGPGAEDARFAAQLARRLRAAGVPVAGEAVGEPAAVRQALAAAAAGAAADSGGGAGAPADAGDGDAAGATAGAAARGLPRIATPAAFAPIVRGILADLPPLRAAPVLSPAPYRWPTFLLPDNLRNVANQIAVIAILAIGMTIVIVTGGIDLSVGSLIALSAVAAAWLVGRLGGEAAGGGALLLAGLAAIALCGAVGAFSGLMITRFRIPPFIATLGMMQVASGVAYIVSHGLPIYRLPDVFVTLGRGVDPALGVPWAVWLMLLLYAAAHLLMTRTPLGRYVYAVGGNAEAARLAGVRTGGVLMFAYTLCGALAGLGGVVTASQLKSGAPTYGLMYELYVIAAVVVGGTSLSGGEGRILGTLIGAFIIAVIQNGMNLTNVESYTQKVVLGLVILGAVLLDRLRQRGWRRPRAASGPS